MNYKHGKVGSPEYRSWSMMIQRCKNSALPAFKNYGGRGIAVCEEWLIFENFYADMGARPSLVHSLDRKDNDGDYNKMNCRWATDSEQRCNRRDSIPITFRGETLSVSAWALKTGLNRTTIEARLAKGWTVDKALTESPMSLSDSGRIGGIARHA